MVLNGEGVVRLPIVKFYIRKGEIGDVWLLGVFLEKTSIS